MMMVIIQTVRQLAIENYRLDLDGPHAFGHWERVRANGIFLSKLNNADKLVVELFAMLHDCCRENEDIDPDHGTRAAEFISTLYPTVLNINTDQFELLKVACIGHNKGGVSKDKTIGACWDADRLDLGRVAIYPDSNFMSTAIARKPEVIDLCYERSIGYDRRFESLLI